MNRTFTPLSFVFVLGGLLAGQKLALRHGADPYTLSFAAAALAGLLATLVEAVGAVSAPERSRRLQLTGWLSAAALLAIAFVPELAGPWRSWAYLGAAAAGTLAGTLDGRRLSRAAQP